MIYFIADTHFNIEKINRTFEIFKNSKEKLIDKYDRIIFFMIKWKLPQYDGRKIKNKGINFNKLKLMSGVAKWHNIKKYTKNNCKNDKKFENQ